MANPQKGEVGFKVGSKSYVFKLGTYAQAVLERRVNMPAPKFFGRPQDQWGVGDTLLVFWAGLYRRHELSEEQAADLIDELGDERVQAILLEAIASAGNRKGAGKSTDDPPATETDGTGTVS